MPIKVRRRISTEASATTGPWIPLDIHQSNFSAIVGVTHTSGATLNYHIQYTLDTEVYTQNSVAAVNVFEFRSNLASGTAFNITFPMAAVRCVVSAAASGVGSPPNIDMFVLQTC